MVLLIATRTTDCPQDSVVPSALVMVIVSGVAVEGVRTVTDTAPMAEVVGLEALMVTTPLNGQAGAEYVPLLAIEPPPETDQDGEKAPNALEALNLTLALHEKVGPEKPEISMVSEAVVGDLPALAAG